MNSIVRINARTPVTGNCCIDSKTLPQSEIW